MTSQIPTDIDINRLTEILRGGEIATELLVLSELTGSLEYADKWSGHITGPAPWQEDFPEDVAEQIRHELARAILASDGGSPAPALIDKLIDHCAGAPVQPAEHPMILKEMGVEQDSVEWTAERPSAADQFSVIVIGSGPSGIATAIRLKHLGIPFVVLEASDDLGGTWHVNTYPGCGVDIASHYFSYSFAKNPAWSRYYAKQPEILAYLRRCADDADIPSHVRFRTEVLSASYDENDSTWLVEARTSDGNINRFRANTVISATGLLSSPKVPDFPGLGDFGGHAFHAAQWDHSVSLEGKKVALVGTGASGNQIGPAVAPIAESLTVFQRSAHWNIGIKNYLESVGEDERWLLANVPAYERWFRARTLLSQNDVNRPAQVVDPGWESTDGSISKLNAQARVALTEYIKDELGERQDLLPLTVPDYPPFTKRMLRDNGWYRMLRRDNVHLVPSRSLTFVPDGVIDDEGVKHEIDVCVFATGFEASKMLATYSVFGRGGTSIRDVWGDDDPRAHYGMTVPGFPNFFILYGPNTNIGTGGSIIFQAETWSRYIVECIKTMIERGAASIECTQSACDAYNGKLDERLAEMVWSVSPGGTWYRNSKGRVTANMPWTTFEYWAMTQRVGLEDFILTGSDGEPIAVQDAVSAASH
ncbi:NAD(P)/FAD-dependent oxidoreductase [Arthrobacter ginkgonis]|uniref:NAD(P)/FAD-dependent oxidoreductase n=1 Tax=Arthrobacter ginkgonis TaxID=1630594 RepID=A0ABP7CT41_9MICC